jgi:hypothetical protein
VFSLHLITQKRLKSAFSRINTYVLFIYFQFCGSSSWKYFSVKIRKFKNERKAIWISIRDYNCPACVNEPSNFHFCVEKSSCFELLWLALKQLPDSLHFAVLARHRHGLRPCDDVHWCKFMNSFKQKYTSLFRACLNVHLSSAPCGDKLTKIKYGVHMFRRWILYDLLSVYKVWCSSIVDTKPFLTELVDILNTTIYIDKLY